MLYRPAPVSNHAWTPERVELLKKLWADGNSGGEIAHRLGMTRNAVIGKVHRLKLPKRRTIISRPPKGNYGRVDRNKLKSAAIRAAAIPDLVDEPFVDPDDGVDVTNLVGLADLNAHDCRWPSGDPLTPHFGFCGKACRGGQAILPRALCPRLHRVAAMTEAELRERIEVLEEDNRQLRRQLGLNADIEVLSAARRRYGLTPQEARFLVCLVKGDTVPRERLLIAAARGASDELEIGLVNVVACKVRKKLRSYGLDFKTVGSVGYRMDPIDRSVVLARIGLSA